MKKLNIYTSDSEDYTKNKKPDLLQNGQQPIDVESVLISEAIQTNDVPFIKSLLQQTNIFYYNKKVHSCWLLHEAIDSKNTEIVSTLLHHGVCRESCSSVKSSNTALHAAVAKGYTPVIKEILRYNANWRKPNIRGQTVIHLPFVSKEMHSYRGCASAVERAELKEKSEKTIIQVIELFLNRGMDINVKNKKERTPLSLAAKYRMKNVVKYLLERGANIFSDNLFIHNLILDEIKSFEREKAIDACDPALVQCIMKDNVEFLNWFLSYGFDVDVTNANGKTALQLALEYNMVHILPTLLKYSTDLTLKDMGRKTILHVFLEANSRDTPMTDEKLANLALFIRFQDIENVVKIMVSKGVSVDATDESGTTPCLLVTKDRRKELLKFMVKRSGSSIVAETIFPIVSAWIDSDSQREEVNDEIISILVTKDLIIRRDNKWNMRLILLAVKHNLQKTFDALIARGFDFKVRTDRKENLLHLAIKEDTSLGKGVNVKDIVRFLIDWGCDVNGRTKEGRTPLHEATLTGNVDVVKILFLYEAEVNARDYIFQYTPLHLAVKSKNYSKDVVEFLIQNHADINARQRAGKTPLHLAIIHGFTDVVTTLLKVGADIDAEDYRGTTPFLEFLLEFAADISDFDANSITPLNDIGTYDDVWHPLFQHFNKLRAIELPYPEVCQSYMKTYKVKFDSVYFAEAEKLKNFVIEGSVTMYDFLHMNPVKRFAYTKHEKFDNLTSWVKSEFPIYHNLIIVSYREAVARKAMLEPAKLAWLELTGIYVPDLCIERILYYSSHKTLKVMSSWMERNTQKRPSESSAGNSAKKLNGATSGTEIWLD